MRRRRWVHRKIDPAVTMDILIRRRRREPESQKEPHEAFSSIAAKGEGATREDHVLEVEHPQGDEREGDDDRRARRSAGGGERRDASAGAVPAGTATGVPMAARSAGRSGGERDRARHVRYDRDAATVGAGVHDRQARASGPRGAAPAADDARDPDRRRSSWRAARSRARRRAMRAGSGSPTPAATTTSCSVRVRRSRLLRICDRALCQPRMTPQRALCVRTVCPPTR